MIPTFFFFGDPLSHAFSLALFDIGMFGPYLIHSFGVLHHTLTGCLAAARWLDPVTPYVVGCIGR